MTPPCAKRSGIFSESLASETILYDKSNNKAHSLNLTVALVWKHADGETSVDDLAGILHRELGVPADPSIVLLALQDLDAAGLLEQPIERASVGEAPSRREIARKLAMAGASAALVPFMASVLAPTPAMASSPITTGKAALDLGIVTAEAVKNRQYPHSSTAQKDLKQAGIDFSHKNYNQEIADLDGVIQALGLPPLP